MRPIQRTNRKARLGVATVELAIVLPVLMVLVFGAIEICQRLQVKQSALIAAYEACRVATRQISDAQSVQAHAETLLSQQNVKGATVTIGHQKRAAHSGDEFEAGLKDIETGDEIRIRIEVPWGRNTISNYVIGDSGGTFQVQAFMLRE